MPITSADISFGKPLSDTDFNLPKMKPEVKEQWVTALRSGDFLQITGALKQLKAINENSDDKRVGYCCLGVLCEVAVKNNVIPAGVQPHVTEKWVDATYNPDTDERITPGHWVQLPEEEQIPKGFWNFDGGSDMPGGETLGWSGLPHEIAKFLAHKNDNGATFGEIADFIEREL